MTSQFRGRLKISGWPAREETSIARVIIRMLSPVCVCIAKFTTDPPGFPIITNERAMVDEQLSRLQVMVLTQCSRPSGCSLGGLSRRHGRRMLREITPSSNISGPRRCHHWLHPPRWIVEAFVQWPSPYLSIMTSVMHRRQVNFSNHLRSERRNHDGS